MSWVQRHAQLVRLIESSRVSRAREEALHAAGLITQTDDNAASAVASHQASLRIIGKGGQEEILGRLLDASLAVLWSAPPYSADQNEIRLAACSSLKSILNVALSESNRDLNSITCLESNREGTVELVRCRLDKKIYVLKSTTKGAAKRGFRSNAPVTERRLLSLARKAQLESAQTAFTPTCIAAFQSPGSLHILMDYCPAGDLYHFLESAGEAPIVNEARNKSGGLLTERYVRRYAIDMVAAISWLHEQSFMHRDIKPGNWLFDKSGHLLLCDLASAAPFALFDEIPPSGNLPEKDESRASKIKQRRVLYRNCCLIGTADYIAPEIFWSADLMSRRRERRLDRERSESYLRASRESMDSGRTTSEGEGIEEDDDDDEPPPDGPGLYGPEVDWWSMGVVLFEMVYKRMPFFSEKIAETMEMIKHHDHYFQLDPWVQCSTQLIDFMRRLITHSEKRIGYGSSNEVKKHDLFRGVNWNKPWEGEKVPFVPNLDSGPHLHAQESPGDLSLLQEEPSVLHSPANNEQIRASSTHLSQMWARESAAFPAFPNSVELSRAAAQEQAERDEEADRSEATITSSSPSAHKTENYDATATLSEVEQLWAGYDPTWIGFSYVPDKTAFTPVVEGVAPRHVSLPSPISSPDSMSNNSNYLYSPQAPPISSLPMVSTPCQSQITEEPQVPPLHLFSTPFHPSAAHNLHRRAIETASRVRSETVDVRPTFATPMRKTSTPNLSSHADRQQMMSNLQTPANPAFSRSVVPASPYPFPLASSIARPKKTPGPMRIPSTGLRRADLERARSASVDTGEGSDSRCSGGSNVKRDISEREAWKELKMAVMQSARKTKRDLVKDMWEERRRENPIQEALTRQRPTLTHAATDTMVRSSPSITQRRNSAIPAEMSKKTQGFGLGALSDALKGRRPNLPRFLSQHQSSQGSKPAPLKPMVSMTSPERPASIMSTSSASSSLLSQQEQSVSNTKSRLTLPNFWARAGDTAKLNKKKSTRQLLLKAQDRATPTKIASRSGSPLLTSFQNISLRDDISRLEGISPHSKVPPSSQAAIRASREHNSAARAMMSIDSDDSTMSLQTGTVVQQQDENRILSSPPKSALINQLRREEGTTRFAMKRRDSREMLSQYRQGINPDETMEEMETVVTQHTRVNLAARRGPKRVMSIQVLQPTTSNRSLGGLSGGGDHSLSSPSLPSFPDAFGGSFGNKKSLQDLRRASMVPLRQTNGADRADVAVPSKGGATGTGAGSGNAHQFRSLQHSRGSRANALPSSRLGILQDRARNSTYTKAESLLDAPPVKKTEVVGEMSMMSGLDWRYTSMQVNISQIEEKLERLKARLRED